MDAVATTLLTLGVVLFLGLVTDAFGRRRMGMALMLQAGVALDMALVATERCLNVGEIILTVVIPATVLSQVIGHGITRISLVHSGEVGAKGR